MVISDLNDCQLQSRFRVSDFKSSMRFPLTDNSYLEQYEAMENDAIDEGLRSLKEEPTITFEDLDRRISEKFGGK